MNLYLKYFIAILLFALTVVQPASSSEGPLLGYEDSIIRLTNSKLLAQFGWVNLVFDVQEPKDLTFSLKNFQLVQAQYKPELKRDWSLPAPKRDWSFLDPSPAKLTLAIGGDC